ncbi:hypothetical protein KA078_01825, partial [Candidatus Woesebacteria bacterium]|nr:hypothetical protein [Candidatus Woesebacteria bacterium]
MEYLNQISILLPDRHPDFADTFTTFLLPFTERCESGVSFNQSHQGYVPHLNLQFADINMPQVHFELTEGTRILELKNLTGIKKKSPHTYTPIMLTDFLKRMQQH